MDNPTEFLTDKASEALSSQTLTKAEVKELLTPYMAALYSKGKRDGQNEVVDSNSKSGLEK